LRYLGSQFAVRLILAFRSHRAGLFALETFMRRVVTQVLVSITVLAGFLFLGAGVASAAPVSTAIPSTPGAPGTIGGGLASVFTTYNKLQTPYGQIVFPVQ
jgi:hypothetical protein